MTCVRIVLASCTPENEPRSGVLIGPLESGEFTKVRNRNVKCDNAFGERFSFYLAHLTNPITDIHADSLHILLGYTAAMHNRISRFF